MVAGNRVETLEENNRRHIKEIMQDTLSWKRELKYATESGKADYFKYCKFMLRVCKGTLKELKSFHYTIK